MDCEKATPRIQLLDHPFEGHWKRMLEQIVVRPINLCCSKMYYYCMTTMMMINRSGPKPPCMAFVNNLVSTWISKLFPFIWTILFQQEYSPLYSFDTHGIDQNSWVENIRFLLMLFYHLFFISFLFGFVAFAFILSGKLIWCVQHVLIHNNHDDIIVVGSEQECMHRTAAAAVAEAMQCSSYIK